MPQAITRELLRQLRDEIDAALAPVAAKHGLTLKTGNATFADTRFTLKLDGALIGAPSKEADTFVALARVYGLDPTWLDRPVIYAHKQWTLRGLKGSKVLIENPAGKMYRAPVDHFIRAGKLAA